MGTLPVCNGPTETETEPDGISGSDARKATFRTDSMRKQPLRLSALIIPKFATFRTEPEVIQPGSEADIVVTIDASLIPAGKEKTFTFPIIIEGVDARPSDRTLNIKVNYTK